MDRIATLEKEIIDLRKRLQEKEAELYEIRKTVIRQTVNIQSSNTNYVQCEQDNVPVKYGEQLPRWAIERYSRQILLQSIGVAGQAKICASKVLIVGAGGLGCPAAMYLAGAGVGQIGIVDYDTVDLTNIHRQVLHGESDEHISKAESAAQSLRSINSHITIIPYKVQLDSKNAMEVASKYDVVLDCTDNVPTRYLLNDLCALAKKPLISGSALKMEGQLTIYGYRAGNNDKEKDSTYIGPCYRCVFPAPPPAEAVGSCSANGVAGPVPGVIGCLQALEAIKLIVGHTHENLLVERMLLFDAEDMVFRNVKLRAQVASCAACSATPTVTRLIDYEVFCKAQAKEKRKQDARLNSERRKLEKEKRMTGQSYYGFRVSRQSDDRTKWIQDVPKSERKIGPPCNSEYCVKGARSCRDFSEEDRLETFRHFWNELDWKGKKEFVRSLVDTVPPKRRRVRHKGDVSRKGDSKLYHLRHKDQRVTVCRVMFLNTLGIKEAMVRCWLLKEDKPKKPKKPLKSLNVDLYVDNLPITGPRCQLCKNANVNLRYVNLDCVKNQYQLYSLYVKDMRSKGVSPASRKTFSKVVGVKNIRIFKPKNENDVCDLISDHNVLPSLNSYQNVGLDKELDGNVVNYYYNGNNDQW